MFFLPHGGYPLLPTTLVSMAWFLSLSLDGCDFVKLSGNAIFSLTDKAVIPYAEVGFNGYRLPVYYGENQWGVQYTDTCLLFPKDDLEWEQDSFWKFGSATYTIATIVGGGGCLFLWTVTVGLVVTERIWRYVGLQLVVAAVFSILSFFWFANSQCSEKESKCDFLYGSIANIYALLFYFAAALSIFLKYPDPKLLKLAKEKTQREFEEFKQDPTATELIDMEIGTGGTAEGNAQSRSSRARRESHR